MSQSSHKTGSKTRASLWLTRAVAPLLHDLQRDFKWWCTHRLFPSQSKHDARCILCSQMEEPLQSLHCARSLWCSQMEEPWQSLHCARLLWCSQMEDPWQSLHCARSLWCSQMEEPLQSLHRERARIRMCVLHERSIDSICNNK